MWISDSPASSASRAERVDHLELALVFRAARGRSARGRRWARVESGASAPFRQRPDSQPPASGLQGMMAIRVCASRYHVGLDPAVQHLVGRLLADEAIEVELGPPRLDDPPGREGGRAEVAHLAGAHEVVSAPSVSAMSVSGWGGGSGRGRCSRCRAAATRPRPADDAAAGGALVLGPGPLPWTLVARMTSRRPPATALPTSLRSRRGSTRRRCREVDAGVERRGG